MTEVALKKPRALKLENQVSINIKKDKNPYLSLSSPLNSKMLACTTENLTTWNTLEVGLQAKRKLRKI